MPFHVEVFARVEAIGLATVLDMNELPVQADPPLTLAFLPCLVQPPVVKSPLSKPSLNKSAAVASLATRQTASTQLTAKVNVIL
jgi:hypothetical protein